MRDDLSRREFIATGGIAAAAVLAGPGRLLASAMTKSEFEKLIPADKRLDPAWVKSLFARGEPQVYSGAGLQHLGMPVSGLCSGHLYLGGDGKLWLWDLFNIFRYTTDVEYKDPLKPSSPLDQGFALRITGETGAARIWALDAKGFSGVTFRGEYPIGRVAYRDPACPVQADLEAFSPFAPLDTDDSSLPATVMRFTLRNPGSQKLEVELGGWLENKSAIETAMVTADGVRKNRVARHDGLLLVEGGAEAGRFDGLLDIGTMSLALLGAGPADRASARVTFAETPARVFEPGGPATAEIPFDVWHPADRLTGAIVHALTLAPGQEATVTFAITWHFPNLKVRKMHHASGRYYANRFKSAEDVAVFLAAQHERLGARTRLWRDTWYDSTLPYWLLDRTMANASTLATSTAYRFSNGRFYGWEGVGNCTGTCTHVWSYEQTMGRLFPELDRALLEQASFNRAVALHADGQINTRDESPSVAVDGQAGTILRAYRRHQMSADDAFLRKNWPNIRLAVEWLMAQDADADGILDRNQSNTLDAEWYGKIAWLSGLYLAALRAAEEMATDMGDNDFAGACRARIAPGRENLVRQLWNGRFFIQTVDPAHAQVVGSYGGCEIDQVLGQSWAFQVGLGRIFPEKETRTALGSLWRYNFAPDVGPYRAAHPAGRWYAMPGEAGLLMCTHPDGDNREFKDHLSVWTAGYLNECMNGFEHQVAGHMIWEGMVLEGLAIERALHDRYDGAKRNPWNEIECGNHYARSMASYGVFLAACGFEYHGPKGTIGFAPRLQPENFRSAFVAAEGWGSFAQTIGPGGQTAGLELKSGRLRLKSFALASASRTTSADVRVNGKAVAATHRQEGTRVTVDFADELRLVAEDRLAIVLA